MFASTLFTSTLMALSATLIVLCGVAMFGLLIVIPILLVRENRASKRAQDEFLEDIRAGAFF